MSWIACLALLLVVISGVLGQDPANNSRKTAEIQKEHAEWIDSVLRSVETLKPGMTRKDLYNLFTQEGGLSTRTQRTYVYRQCSHIKVDVTFAPASREGPLSDEMPGDVIVSLSRPYLQYTNID